MSMTDPIADFLSRIRNGIHSRRQTISAPASTVKEKLAEILKQEGYISGFSVKTIEGQAQGQIEVELKWDKSNRNAIEGIERYSRPGQRSYAKAHEIPKVRNGLGIAVLTTSRGLMTDREARKQSLGGEIICAVW
jgi:small subunit ribosomal protein S8